MLSPVLLLLPCLLSLSWSLPRASPSTHDWTRYKPRHLGVTPWPQGRPLPLVDPATPSTSPRHPGYKRGTRSMAGQCGLPATSQGRIVGGEEAAPHSYPWMAALFIDDQWFCGGTLISDEWVLTAAHCAQGARWVNTYLTG